MAATVLPWVPASQGVLDNFTLLTSLGWQVHVYGDATRMLGRRRRVMKTGVAAARLSLASSDGSGRSAAQCGLSRTA